MSAPHPPYGDGNTHKVIDYAQNDFKIDEHQNNSSNTETEFKALSLCFADRSATLMHMKQYEKCINDINSALNLGIPKIFYCTILERKAQCLIALNRYKEAKTALEICINSLEKEELQSKKHKKLYDHIKTLIETCNNEIKVKKRTTNHNKNNKRIKQISDLSADELIFAYNTPIVPSLKGRNNPNIPSLSNALRLQWSPSQGRHIIATRDIKPGELLSVEKGFVTCVNIKDQTTLQKFCCFCLARCAVPLPCPECSMVVFCSVQCRNKGIENFHWVECESLPNIAATKFPFCFFQSYRMVAQTPFLKLKKLIPKYQKEFKAKHRKGHGFNEESVYDSADYQTAYHLEGNISQRNALHLIELCSVSFTLTYLLVKSKRYFVDENGNTFDPNIDDMTLVASAIFTHLTSVPCNCSELIELQMNISEKTNKVPKTVGAGVFPATCLFNHSCNPSVFGFTIKNYNICYAVRFIRANTEVRVTYGKLYYDEDIKERRKDLLKSYAFTCTCKACLNDWKLDDSEPKLRDSRLKIAKFMSGKGPRFSPKNKEDLEDQLETIVNKFISEKERVDNSVGEVKYNLKTLVDTIEFFDRNVELPNSIYVQAQETLIDYLLERCSCNYFKE